MDTYKKILPLPFLCQSERICGSSFTMTTDEEKLWQVWGQADSLSALRTVHPGWTKDHDTEKNLQFCRSDKTDGK